MLGNTTAKADALNKGHRVTAQETIDINATTLLCSGFNERQTRRQVLRARLSRLKRFLKGLVGR